MGMYMKIDGIEGESKQKGHENWIDISAADWHFSNAAGGMPDSSGGRTGGEGVCGLLSIGMSGSSVIPTITQYCLMGTTTSKINIESVTASKSAVIYNSWELSDCAFNDISFSDMGSGTSSMPVRITVSYSKFDFKLTTVTDAGASGTTKELKYNVTQLTTE